jgi:hypothetical protein
MRLGKLKANFKKRARPATTSCRVQRNSKRNQQTRSSQARPLRTSSGNRGTARTGSTTNWTTHWPLSRGSCLRVPRRWPMAAAAAAAAAAATPGLHRDHRQCVTRVPWMGAANVRSWAVPSVRNKGFVLLVTASTLRRGMLSGSRVSEPAGAAWMGEQPAARSTKARHCTIGTRRSESGIVASILFNHPSAVPWMGWSSRDPARGGHLITSKIS